MLGMQQQMIMPQNDSMITLEFMQWALGFAVAGYPVLMGVIWYLLKELLKAKDEEAEILREVLPLTEKLTEIYVELSWLVEGCYKRCDKGE